MRVHARKEQHAPPAHEDEVERRERELLEALGGGEVLAEIAELGEVGLLPLVERVVAGLHEPREAPVGRRDDRERLGAGGGVLDVGAVAIGERHAAVEAFVGEGLQPPVEDGQIGLTRPGRQANDALPQRPPRAPGAAVRANDARADVRRAVDDHVEELVLRRPRRAARRPSIAPLARERRAEAMDARVGEVERDRVAEKGGSQADEALGGVVEVGEDRRIDRGVRVGRASACEVLPRVRRIEGEEVAAKEGVGVVGRWHDHRL